MSDGKIEVTMTAVLTIVDADGNVTTTDQLLTTEVSPEEAEYLKANARNLTIIPPGEKENAP